MNHIAQTAVALIVQTLLLACPAFANMAETGRVERRQEALNSRIKFQGTLTCAMSVSNDGTPCALKFKESNTGRVYELANSTNARRLYNDGAKKVAIVGTIENGSTINVATVSTE